MGIDGLFLLLSTKLVGVMDNKQYTKFWDYPALEMRIVGPDFTKLQLFGYIAQNDMYLTMNLPIILCNCTEQLLATN